MYETYLAYCLSTQSTRSPGLRVIEPKPPEAQVQRGNLYILVELMGESPVRGQAMRQMLSTVQQTYYTARGSLSDILAQAVHSAHDVLYQLNQRSANTDLRAGITCAGLVQDHLVIASAGPALALIATGDRLDQFPQDPGHYSAPLGGSTAPDVNFYRRRVRDGDVLFIGESDWLLISSIRTLGGAIANTNKDNRFDVVEYLRRQSNHAEILGLLVVMEKAKKQVDADTSGKPWSKTNTLPTSVGTTPPVRDVPTDVTPTPKTSPTSRRETRPIGTRPSLTDSFDDLTPGSAPPVTSPGGAAETPAMSDELSGPRVRARRAAPRRIGMSWLRKLAQNILPESKTQRREERARANWVEASPTPVDQDILPPSLGQTETRASAQPFVPPARTRGDRARLYILLAILIPLLVFIAIAAINWQQGSREQAEGAKLVDLAENQLFMAQQALSVGDSSTARARLTEAQGYLDQAIGIFGYTDRIKELSAQIQKDLQSVLRVQPLYGLGLPLTTFPQNASPSRVIVESQDAYVLDIGRQIVEHFRLDPTRTIIEESSGPVISEGDVVEGVTVGRLVDITWQPRIPGFADKASLVVLDRNNNLFRYNRIEGATHLRLDGADQFQTLTEAAVYNGRLYVADEQADQIYRLSPSATGYGAPEPWFAPETQVELAGVKEMLIDSDIWLLLENGNVMRYRTGQQVPFSLENIAGLAGEVVDMALEQADSGNLYLADESQERVLVFDKNGNYIKQFQAAENDVLRGLRGLYLDEATGTVFFLTQTSLYQQTLPK